MNKITIGQYEFTDDTILENPQKFISNSMLADALEIDTLEFSVYSLASGVMYIITADGDYYATSADEPYVADEGELIKVPYGTAVNLYKDDVLRGQFYIKSVQRTGLYSFKVVCISAIGLLDKQMHNGGIYNGDTVGDLVADIMGGVTYTIESDVAEVVCYGWLPRASARDNLTQVLFSCGASVLKEADGTLAIRFNGARTPSVIQESAVYIGGSVDNPQTVTSIHLIEHAFVAATDNVEEVLFDNVGQASVTNAFIYFDEPFHSLRADGITLVSSGANFAELTGTGTLYGKKYTHSQRELIETINNGAEPNEVNIKDATLVSAVNSNNVMARLKGYYENADVVNLSLVDQDGIKTGDYLTLTDPFGEQFDGIVQQIDETISGIDRANAKLVRGWTPSNFGNNYRNVDIFTTANIWDVPADVTNIRIVLIGGGQGGQSGANGTGTTGGNGGKAGSAGKVLIQDITIPAGVTKYNVIPATGGNGGVQTAGDGNPSVDGANGGASRIRVYGTSVDLYTSDDGAVLENGFIETFSGVAYATSGIDGADGADGATYSPYVPQTTLEWGGITYHSGTNAEGRAISTPSGEIDPDGGLGGGAAVGSNGNDGTRPATGYDTVTDGQGHTSRYREGGNGGNGADASIAGAAQSIRGAGGNGGHGGGGGGEGGNGDQSGDYTQPASFIKGVTGTGGTGSNGGKGGSGAVLIYY